MHTTAPFDVPGFFRNPHGIATVGDPGNLTVLGRQGDAYRNGQLEFTFELFSPNPPGKWFWENDDLRPGACSFLVINEGLAAQGITSISVDEALGSLPIVLENPTLDFVLPDVNSSNIVATNDYGLRGFPRLPQSSFDQGGLDFWITRISYEIETTPPIPGLPPVGTRLGFGIVSKAPVSLAAKGSLLDQTTGAIQDYMLLYKAEVKDGKPILCSLPLVNTDNVKTGSVQVTVEPYETLDLFFDSKLGRDFSYWEMDNL